MPVDAIGELRVLLAVSLGCQTRDDFLGLEPLKFFLVALASDHVTKHAEGEKPPHAVSLIPCFRLYRSMARSMASSAEPPFATG
jgi:hypothetical protein